MSATGSSCPYTLQWPLICYSVHSNGRSWRTSNGPVEALFAPGIRGKYNWPGLHQTSCVPLDLHCPLTSCHLQQWNAKHLGSECSPSAVVRRGQGMAVLTPHSADGGWRQKQQLGNLGCAWIRVQNEARELVIITDRLGLSLLRRCQMKGTHCYCITVLLPYCQFCYYCYYYYIHYYYYVLNWPEKICDVCLVPRTPCAVNGTLIVDCTCIAPVPAYTQAPSTLPHQSRDSSEIHW